MIVTTSSPVLYQEPRHRNCLPRSASNSTPPCHHVGTESGQLSSSTAFIGSFLAKPRCVPACTMPANKPAHRFAHHYRALDPDCSPHAVADVTNLPLPHGIDHTAQVLRFFDIVQSTNRPRTAVTGTTSVTWECRSSSPPQGQDKWTILVPGHATNDRDEVERDSPACTEYNFHPHFDFAEHVPVEIPADSPLGH